MGQVQYLYVGTVNCQLDYGVSNLRIQNYLDLKCFSDAHVLIITLWTFLLLRKFFFEQVKIFDFSF